MSNTMQNKPGGANKNGNGNGKNTAGRPASERPATTSTVVRPQSSATANGTNGAARPRPGVRPQPKKAGFRLRPLDIGLIVVGVLIVAVVAYSVISGANKGAATGATGGTTVAGSGQVVSVTGPDGNPMNVLAGGSQAPVFTLPGDDGNTYNLASMKGKTVLIEFMAPWCPHCQDDAPEFAKIYNDLKTNPNFAMYGINATPYDKDHKGLISMADLTWFRDQFSVPYPLLFDKAVQDQIPPVATAYQINYYPTFYIVKPDGTIATYMMADQQGALTEARVTTEVKKYLK